MSASAVPTNSETRAAPKRQLTLLDTTSIIVGIIIGSTIYESTPGIASSVPNTTWLIGVWILGGLLSLVGALCYAELGNAYPKEGGDYVYLTQAFGRKMGFVFAWAQLWVVRPGSIGAFAYVFARYANQIWHWGGDQMQDDRALLVAIAAATIVVITGINVLGLREGKWTQNLLSIAKYGGLLVIVVAGLLVSAPAEAAAAVATPVVSSLDVGKLGFAMIMIFYAYSGWNEMAYVGSEVRDPRKNILRALLLGTVAVTLVYVLLNLAFLHALGFDGMRGSKAVASDVLRLAMGNRGSQFISVLICITALGGINGMIFTGSRIYYAMGTEHQLYAWLGRWNSRRDTPLPSLLIQAAVTLAFVIGFGLMPASGENKAANQSGFEAMVMFTAPVFWFFLLCVALSLFVLRYRRPELPRPYRVPLYPVIPALFCLSCSYMLYSSFKYAFQNKAYEGLWAVGLVVMGLALSFYDPKTKE